MKRKNNRVNYKTTKRLRSKVAKPFVPRVKSLETKTFNVVNIGMNFDTTSSKVDQIIHINPIPVGGSSQARIGKKISGTAVSIKGYVRCSPDTTYDKASLMLVWVRSPNLTALPDVTDILTGRTSNDHTNLDHASKYKILRRWDYNMIGSSSQPSTGLELQFIDEYIKLKENKYETLWSNGNTDGSYPGIDKGALLLLSVGLNAFNEDSTPVFRGQTRFYFNDV